MTERMEQTFKELTEANNEENRAKWAKEWRKQGREVIGLLCTYVPEELIFAAGMLPWRISGTWRESTPHALVYRISTSCRFCNHALEALLAGDLDFLNGVVSTNLDDDIKCLWDVWDYLGKGEFRHIIHLPHKSGGLALRLWTRSVSQLKRAIEQYSGQKLTDEKIFEAITVYNRTRALLGQLYQLRKRKVPPLSGAEMLGVTTASMVMPKDEFNRRLEELLPYLDDRKAPLKAVRPRLLVSSDMLDNPDYIKLAEDSGSFVAMDDLDTGSRYFLNCVDLSLGDPILALASRYLNKPESPRMLNWDKQVDRVIDWVREFEIDGVLDMPLMCSFPREYMRLYYSTRLKAAGVPNISVKREYHFANSEQLRTRIGAFIEMLETRR